MRWICLPRATLRLISLRKARNSWWRWRGRHLPISSPVITLSDIARGEQLIGGHGPLGGAVRGADPGPAHRDPPPAQHHRAVLGPVTHRRAVRVVAALRAR